MPPTSVQPRPSIPLSPDDLSGEFVAATSGYIYADAARALAWAIDDLTSDFGDDLYGSMLNDPQIAACASIIKAGILEDVLAVSPAIDDESDPDYERAHELAEAANDMLLGLDLPLKDALWDMLDAPFFGNRVAELVFKTQETEEGPKLWLRALKPKPRHATAFVVDSFLNILGLIGAKPGERFPSFGGASFSMDELIGRVIPRQKFAVLTWRPKDGDPRGTSLLRPAYDPWWRKRQIYPEYVKYITLYAMGSLIGYTAPAAADAPASDPLGNLLEPDPGQPVGAGQVAAALTPEQKLLKALVQFKSGTALVAPGGSKVDSIKVGGEGKAYLDGIAEANLAITKAILTQSLATEEGEHQARAAAEIHQDVLDTIVRLGKDAVQSMLYRDVLRLWVEINYGPDVVALTPHVALGQTEEQDKASLMGSVAQLQSAGYLHPSQLPLIDAMLGLPVRDLSLDEMLPGELEPPEEPEEGAEGEVPPEEAGAAGEEGPEQQTGEAEMASFAAPSSRLRSADLDRLAAVSARDARAAAAYWRRGAPAEYRDLIDAEAI